MKFKHRGWPQGMMGISMRMRTQFFVVDYFQVKMSLYIVPKHTKWRIWKVENPYFAIEKSLHIQRMTM